MNRFWELDALRGIAIIMMVFFHFLWDLNYFGIVEVSLYTGFWGLFQKATAGLFLLLVGAVLTINFQRYKKKFLQNFLNRGAIIFGAGLILTFGTLIFLPDQFIYFGVLHLIGVSIILSIPFIRQKYFNLLLAIFIIFLPAFINLYSFEIPFLVWLGLSTPMPALDFFPVIPWFGAVLIGIFLGNTFYKNGKPKISLKEPDSKTMRLLQFLGRKSLLIYFLQQPILFPVVYLISIII